LNREFFSKRSVTLIIVIMVMSVSAFIVGCGPEPLQVKDVQSDPFSYTGEITVIGIVSAFAPDDNMFGIKDIEDMKQCGFAPTCSAWVMPVVLMNQEPFPAFGDEVKVTGTFTSMDGHPIFEVKKYKVTGSYAQFMQ